MRFARGSIAFINLDGKSPVYRDKAIALLAMLRVHPNIDGFLNVPLRTLRARDHDLRLEH